MKGKNIKSRKYNALLKEFLETHPHAEYFLLDGSHKTTAAALSHRLIPALIIEKDSDFKEARRLIEKGEFFGWHAVEKSIKEAITVLAKHHLGTKKMMTVEDKTKLMIKNRIIPRYMIVFFKRRNCCADKSP